MASVYYPRCRAVIQVILDGFDNEGSDTDPLVLPVLAVQATIHRNKYSEADAWELVCDAGDLPIDPQLIRTGSVEIYLFHTDGADEGRQLSRQFADVDDPAQSTGRTPNDLITVEENLSGRRRFTEGNPPMIAGLFDSASLEMSSSGKWVTIQGQDYTALLAAKQWPPKKNGKPRPVPIGKPLDVWANDILREADPSGRLSVAVEHVSTLPVVGQNETRNNKAGGIPIEEGTSYWDVIYKVVTRYGFICFIRGLDLVITRPRNLMDVASPTVKRLAWGHNIEHLELTRNLGKETVPRIVVVSYNPDTRQRIQVEYPKRRQPAPVGTLGASKDEFQIVTLYGVSDPSVLQRAAENLFALLGHSERRMVVKTRDLRDSNNRDLLNLSAGDAVDIDWEDFDSGIIGNPDIAEGAKVQHLVSRGFNSRVAGVIARQYTKFLAAKRPLRVREVSYHYSASEGIQIELELVDFVTVDGTRGANATGTQAKDRVG